MNIKKTFLQITTYLFYLVATIQIVLGVCYVGANLFQVQMLPGSKEYLEISNTLLTDEYIGILYPLLLKIPSCTVIYLVQLAAAGCALYFWVTQLTQKKNTKKNTVFVMFFLLTIPMLLQLHMTLLPNSLAFSSIIFFITCWMKQDTWKNSLCMGLALLIAALLVPDTLFVTGILLAWKILQDLRKRQILWKNWLIYALSFVLAISIGAAVQTPGSRGRIQKTFWAAMFQRTVSEYFSQSFMVWDVRVQQTFTIEEFMECAKRSDNMMYVAGPRLEEKWGKETANELYKEMTLDCTRIRTKQVVSQIRDDMVDSVLMPFSVLWQDNTRRMSATGFNYDGFRQNWPEMSIFYFYYGIYASLILAILGLMRNIVIRKRLIRRTGILLFAAIIQGVITTMSTGNAVDYADLWLIVLWWGSITMITIDREEEI